MFKHLSSILCAVALLGAPQIAAAQQEEAPLPPNTCPPGTEPVYPPVAEAPVQTTVVHRIFSPGNASLTLGGGLANFARERISDLNTSVAGTWDMRLLYGTRTPFGFEAAYQGTAAGGSDPTGTGGVQTEQVTGSARLNLTRARIQPFLTAGVGWINLNRSVTSPEGVASSSISSNSFAAPFGGGIAAYFGQHGVIDLRGSYELVASKDFAVNSTAQVGVPSGVRPDIWTAELRAGYAF